MSVFRLPVSRMEIVLREPSGGDDLLLREARDQGVRLAVALVGRLVRGSAGEEIDASALTVTDLDTALLLVRKRTLGDRVRADVRCANEGCRARVDIEFRVSDYLAHHAPREVRGVSEAGEPGWRKLDGTDVTFRLPTAGDQVAIMTEADPVAILMTRCIRPATVSARDRRRIESAMEALAPSLQNELEGRCPECGATVTAVFDPQRYVLAELSAQASSLYEEIHLVAGRYHWPEADILALSRVRRVHYADRIRGEGAAG